MWVFWLIASGIFFILEIFTTGFLIFLLGIAGVLALITSFITESVAIQTVVFAISSCIFIIFTRPLINKLLKVDKSSTVPTNVYSLIGKKGVVVEDINSLAYTGKVKISGELWSAVSDTDLKKGTRVTVLQIDGVKLKVEPTKEVSKIN